MFPRNSIIIVAAAPQPTAIIQQNHINSNSKRARVCDCERGKFATQVVLFSVQVMALGSANREVNMTAGEVRFLERASCIISSSEQPRSFCFWTCFFSFVGTAQTSSESHSSSVYSTYRKRSKVHTVSSTIVSTRARQRKQVGMKEQVKCCREPAMYEYTFSVSFFLFLLFLLCLYVKSYA